MKARSRAATTIAGLVLISATLVSCTRPPSGGGTTTTTPDTTMPGGEHGEHGEHGEPGEPGEPGGPGGSAWKGPNPTAASAATRGTFAIANSRVTGASGFGGGVVYYPTAEGVYGGIVLAPPFTVQNSANDTTGMQLASHGFVVLTFDTRTAGDFPSSRATQGAAALRWLTETSSVRQKVDRNRLAFGGFSMGGGATMELANRTPSLKAAMPMVPWHTTKSFSRVTVPTLIIAAQGDTVASVASHAQPFYRSIPAGTPKMYVEVRGASHFMPSNLPPAEMRYATAFMKRYVDGDTRYTQFLTVRDSTLSGWQQSGIS